MIVDGKGIAHEMFESHTKQIQALGYAPVLVALVADPTPATLQYLSIKRKKAGEIGILLEVIDVSEKETTEVVAVIEACVAAGKHIIVQLPFPERFDTNVVLNAIPASHDVDRLGGEAEKLFYTEDFFEVLPPVVGAIQEICTRYDIDLTDKKVVVVGEGRLVGRPASHWAQAMGAEVVVLHEESAHTGTQIAEADVLILGAGAGHIVTADMVKEGVVVFDAGTSESSGEMRGDAHPEVSEKASVYTPVPGGIGPITVAMLYKNLLILEAMHREASGV